jgi:ankyrin repeat protein
MPLSNFIQIILRRSLPSDECFESSSIVDNCGRSPLHYAAINGLSSHIALLIESDQKLIVDQRDTLGHLPIMYAAMATTQNGFIFI